MPFTQRRYRMTFITQQNLVRNHKTAIPLQSELSWQNSVLLKQYKAQFWTKTTTFTSHSNSAVLQREIYYFKKRTTNQSEQNRMKVILSWGVTSLQNVVHASFMPCYTQQYVVEIRSAASIQGLQVVNMYECMLEWACICVCLSEWGFNFLRGNFCLLVFSIYWIIEWNF